MNRFGKAVLGVACLFVAVTPAMAQTLDDEMLNGIEADVENVRELELMEEFDVEIMSLADYQQETADDLADYPDEAWKRDTQVLAAFGLVDPDADLYQIYSDAYGGGFVGYYDHNTNEMVLIDFGSGNGDELSALGQVTYAHETVHALQDQHFTLDQFFASDLDGDQSLSGRSLVEGDAMFTENLFLEENRDLAEAYLDEMIELSEDGGIPETDLPEYLERTLSFPYQYGPVFVETLFDEGGWDLVNEAYENPPQSTEQILHPDKYLEGDAPIEVAMDDHSAVLGRDWEELFADTHGEFIIGVILGDADIRERSVTRASEGWGGDTYSVLGNGDETAVVWDTAWDTDRDAREFSRVLAQREEHRLDADGDDEDDRVIIEGDDQVVIIEQDGDRVMYVQAPTLVMAEDLLDEL